MQRVGTAGYNLRMARRESKLQRCEVAMLVDAETGERSGSAALCRIAVAWNSGS